MTKPSDILPPGLESLSIDRTSQTNKPRKSLGQDEFFELMVAQLKSQDPLKPLDSNEFIGQMAQFSTVTGIENMQNSISELAATFQSSQALQASTLVGRRVLVPGSQGVLPADGSLTAAAELPQSTGSLSANIYDTRGQLVRHLSLGAHQAGTVQFDWDGLMDNGQQAPAGTYSIGVTAAMNDETSALETLTSAQVESVTLGRGGAGMQLNLLGLGPVDVSRVRQLL